MPKALGLKPVGVFDDEDKQLTDKSRVAQATINDNFRLLASRINRLEKNDEENRAPQAQFAQSTTTFAIPFTGGALPNVPGGNLTFTPDRANAFAVVNAIFDVEGITAGYGLCMGRLLIAGGIYGSGTVVTDPVAVFQSPTNLTRFTIAQNWLVQLPTAGVSYSINMCIEKTVNAGSAQSWADHTTMVGVMFQP